MFDYWEPVDVEIVRKWTMPNKWTFKMKPIYQFVSNVVENESVESIYIPYAGYTRFETSKKIVYVDITEGLPPPYILGDAVEETKKLIIDGFSPDLVILDPPYSHYQVKRTYKGRDRTYISLVKDLVMEMGPRYVVTCAFNSNGMGKSRGYVKRKILLVACGGNHNDYITMLEEAF